MTRYGNNGFWSLSLASVMAVIGVVTGRTDPTLAQIVPDQTLGAEQSQVMPNVDVRGGLADRIDGGAIRGANLFHSFGEFNVRELQRVYFANPEGIENILGRVTGSNRSDILGTLGVDGGANLFLINPNGIVFGPNAQLDIRGSFVAGTADRFKFPDGSEFRATNPNAPPLVTVNIPIGLQYGSEPPAALVSEADLEVGRDLALSGGSVTSTGHLSAPEGLVVVEGVAGDVQVRDVTAQSATLYSSQVLSLEESQLRTTGDLNLLADQTVRVRDSVQKPFLALSGGNLLVQGTDSVDILALNHPQTPFQSRGSLTLVSDGNVSGDAHFYSGGGFSILNLAGEPGTFVSLYDPIISAIGNVTFGDYTGVSLKVEATGSITAGNITITEPDLTSPSTAIGNFTATPGADPNTVQEVFLTNGFGSVSDAQLEAFLNLNNGNLDQSGVDRNATEGSALETTFRTNANNQIFSFTWEFLTSEGTPSPSFNDFAFFTISVDPTEVAIGQGLNQLADTNFLNFENSSDLRFTETTEPQTLSVTVPIQGNVTVGFGLVDENDSSVDSGLRISNFSLRDQPPPNQPNQPNQPEPLAQPISLTLSTDPDLPILTSSPALILRAGENPLANEASTFPTQYGGIPGSPPVVPPTQFNESPLDPDAPPAPATITINGNISTSSDHQLSTATSGGPVILSAPGDIIVTGNIDTSSEDGNGGRVEINSRQGNIHLEGTIPETPRLIDTSSSQGGSGNITLVTGSLGANDTPPTINPDGIVSITNFNINSDAVGSGNAGDIDINAGSIAMQNSQISAGISSSATSNQIDTELFLFSEDGVPLPPDQLGRLSSNDDGSSLDVGSSSFLDSYLEYQFMLPGTYILGVGEYSSSAINGGITGEALDVGDAYTLHISLPNRTSEPNGRGDLINENEDNNNPNNTPSQPRNLAALPFSLDENPNVSSSTLIPHISISGQGDNGNNYDYYSFEITDAGDLGIFDIDTNAGGQAGSINLTATGNMIVEGSSISNRVSGATVNTANITINAGSFDLISGSQIDASTIGKGTGGSILVDIDDLARVDTSSIRTTVGTGAEGNGGDITVTAGQVQLDNGASLDTSNSGSGVGGSIQVQATNGVSLAHNSSIRTAVSSGETVTGNGGDIGIDAASLSITGGSRLNAQTSGTQLLDSDSGLPNLDTARAGNITVNTTGDIDISGNSPTGLLSGLFTASELAVSGTGGNITVNADGTLRVSDRAVLNARTNSASPGGNIDVEVNRLVVESGGQLITASSSSALAGNITVTAPGGVILSGSAPPFAVSPSSPSPFEEITGIPELRRNANLTPVGDGILFPYYSFTIAAAGSVGIFDIDGGYEGFELPGSIDTELFLFNRDTGELLAQNDDDFSSPLPGGNGSTSGYDSFIRYAFESPGRYVIGVGEFNSFASSGALISGNAPDAAPEDVYTLEVTLNGLGQLDQPAPPRESISGLFAAATVTGNAGNITVNTNQLTVEDRAQISSSSNSGLAGDVTITASSVTLNSDGQIVAETNTGGGGDLENRANITLQGLETLEVNNGLISSSTDSGVAGDVTINASDSVTLNGTFTDLIEGEQGGVLATARAGGTAGSLTINTDQLTIQEGAQAAVSSRNGSGNAGQVDITARILTLNSGGQIAAETNAGGGGDLENRANITLQGLETLEVNNGLISSSTDSGVAGDVTINASDSVTLNGTFTDLIEGEQGGVLATARDGGTAGSLTINTDQLTIQEGAQAAVSSRNGSGNAGDILIEAEEVTLNSGGRIEAQTDAGGSNRPANITLQGLENLDINNGLISSSTESGVAGRVSIDASESVTVNNGLISSSSNSGRSGSVLIDGSESITVNNGLISSSTTSGFAGSVTIGALDSVTLNGIFNTTATGEAQGGVLATATAGGTAGSLTINTQELTLENGAAVAVSSREGSGNAGDITITSEEVTLNSGGRITAETDAGGRNRPSNITLQGLETLELDEGTISASTSTGVAGNVSINSSDSVELDEGSRITVIATGVNGTAGNLSVNTGEFLVRDGSEVSVSSRQGEAGNLNITANSLGLNQGSLTAEAGQGEGGANINLDVSGFLRLDNESLISALATGNATGGNININAQYVIASFPTGSEGSDIVADAVLGNGGQITINALGIFGLEFRPARTPLNDITASSQGGAAGTVQITTLGIDPSRGLAALPLNFIDVSGLVGGQCSASGGDGELSQFTIIGRGGLPLNPTDPLAPEAEASDWVTFDPESDRISPQAHTPIRITPFTSSVTPQQLAQFPSLCYQSWSTSAIAP